MYICLLLKKGLSGFLKGIKVLIGHRFFSTVGVVTTSIAEGIRIYDHQQVYRKAAKAQGTINCQFGF